LKTSVAEAAAMTRDGCLQIGTPPVLPSEIERVRRKMTGYGHADG